MMAFIKHSFAAAPERHVKQTTGLPTSSHIQGPFPVETLRSRGRFERKQKLSNHNIIEEVETVQKSIFRGELQSIFTL